MIKYILLAFLLITTPCWAGNTYYVDQNHVSASDSNDGSEGSPWETAHYGAAQLDEGDTLYIKEGYYHYNTGNRYEPGINPVNSGTAENPITIKAYGNDDVYIMGTSAIGNPASSMTSPAIGAYKAVTPISYIVIDGFKIYGNATFWRANNCTLQNCEIWAGGVYEGTDDFGSLVRFENTDGCRMYNCLLRDGEDPYSRGINSPMVMVYDSANLTIDNNELRDGVSYAIRLKDNCDTTDVKLNFIRDMGDYAIAGGNQSPDGVDIEIFQNVIIDCSGGIFWRSYVDQVKVYNNTFYNCAGSYGTVQHYSATALEYFNNIYDIPSGYYMRCMRDGGLSGTDIDYMDYNCFDGSATWGDISGQVATTLSGWQTFCNDAGKFGANEGDDNSVTTDPGFANAGGQTEEDYKRSSYPTNGRGGSYSSVMGAYLSDSTSIGLEFGGGAEASVTAIIGVSIQ